ncbi:MAG: hypothetical protein KF791_00420 [Verrucomicrobiae bacterium]|nr:hypothetical protein [Verrucomicrobiae bacterium]
MRWVRTIAGGVIPGLMVVWAFGQGHPPEVLSTVWRIPGPGGGGTWGVERPDRPAPTTAIRVFRGVVSKAWPEGLVPVFAIEGEGRAELRRLPPLGRENFSDPLCFLLPPEGEPDAALLAGRWTLESESEEGRRHRLAMEWSVAGERAAGRLDQETDFRFAYLTGATWRQRQLEVMVEYISDRYEMSGTWEQGRLRGTWRQVPEGDSGRWEARRPERVRALPPSADTLPLFEWRRDGGSARWYGVGESSPGDGWRREPLPIGRAWPLPEGGASVGRPPGEQRP